MTITEATHALARRQRRLPASIAGRTDGARLVDVMARVEPTWVEAVAVVQAVCAQLPRGEAAPALETIRLSATGAVTFPRGGRADDIAIVAALGHLLARILGRGGCPMTVWDTLERARSRPASLGTAEGFGAALSCLPVAQGGRELAQFVQSAGVAPPFAARPSAPPRRSAGTASWAGLAAVLFAVGGVTPSPSAVWAPLASTQGASTASSGSSR